MLKAQKKLTKKQIKEDKFVTFYFQSQEFLKENSKTILYSLGALVAAVLIFAVYSGKSQEKEENAVVELTKAKIKFFSSDYAGSIPILKNLVEEYDGTQSAEDGNYYLASSYFQMKNYPEAEKYFRQYLDDGADDILTPSAIAGIAACFEEQDNYQAAAQRYRDAADKFSENFMAPQNLLNSARCFVLAGKPNVAREVLTQLLDKYQSSPVKVDAELLLSELAS